MDAVKNWLRAAVLGANDSLLSTASLMMGVGAVRKDHKTRILVGVAGLMAGACSMAIGELVSMYSQYDMNVNEIKRDTESGTITKDQEKDMKRKLPSLWQAAVASALAFTTGALVPLLAVVVVAAVGVSVLGFGAVSASPGKMPMATSIARVFIGGLMAMRITFGLTKLIGPAIYPYTYT